MPVSAFTTNVLRSTSSPATWRRWRKSAPRAKPGTRRPERSETELRQHAGSCKRVIVSQNPRHRHSPARQSTSPSRPPGAGRADRGTHRSSPRRAGNQGARRAPAGAACGRAGRAGREPEPDPKREVLTPVSPDHGSDLDAAVAKARAAMAEIDNRRAARATERAAEPRARTTSTSRASNGKQVSSTTGRARVAPTEVRRLISKWRLGVVDKDEELIERYQRAAVTARVRGNEVRRARADGQVLYLEEDEAAQPRAKSPLTGGYWATR